MSVCGEMLFDSKFIFSSLLLFSREQARLAAAKSLNVVLATDKSARASLCRNASNISKNWKNNTTCLKTVSRYFVVAQLVFCSAIRLFNLIDSQAWLIN